MDRRSLLLTGAAVTAAAAVPAATAQAEPLRRKPFRVHLLVFDGADDLDFIAPNEVFQHAAHTGVRIETRLVTGAGPGTITSAFGTRIEAAGWAPDEADLVVVAGGGYGMPDGTPGVPQEIERGHLPAALREARRPGLVFASVCTGAMLLSAAGITRGRPCTTHHLVQEELARQGGRIMPGRVVDDGDLVTSGGITSGLDLALWLLERNFGAQVALSVETVMEYERRGTVWRR
ncbi:DJ-1/PfpI family protein [Saccharopolyspora antimicrobica]|uniref:DJ-1/PfpI family protein n=1 Tax=Saccharopolyspora antimicrobica TaxID=455193 RepID=A0A1I4VFF2_9PSEU|nr:DJ-1/PfpI family protein [Saccharopolyspora antimicrobica]RKT86278.1 DJ-1/PfpI family protein [Saccharopolyspora antimicrobica]SFM99905.1 DJ-1/PfpI family protein [Saccharopolyspora antimicrobica]